MRKKLILWLGISLVCFTAFVLSVRATEKETVSLSNAGGQIEATLELPVEEDKNGNFIPPEEVVALQISFQISGQGSVGKDEVSFIFDSSLPQGAVKEYRYQEDTGVLNIYISGRENIYSSKNISLGKVSVNSDEKAVVKVIKNSFKTVNKAHGMYEGEVNTGDGGQTVNNGSGGGNNNGNDNGDSGGDDDVGEVMRPPEETGKPDEDSGGENSGGEIFPAGGQDGKEDGKEDRYRPSAGTTGSAEKILNAALSKAAGYGIPVSDTEPGNETEHADDWDTEEDSGDAPPPIPDDSLWEDGAKLWREKTGAIGMDVWTKIFFGLFAGSAAAAGGIGISMAVRTSSKHSRRKRRRTQAGRSVYTQARPRPQAQPARSKQAGKGKRAGTAGQSARTKHAQKGRATGRAQSSRNSHGQPVWKDNKKPYVRKKRKIG